MHKELQFGALLLVEPALDLLLVKINCYILTWRRVTESAKTSYLQAKRKLTLLNDATRTECHSEGEAVARPLGVCLCVCVSVCGSFNKLKVETFH